MLGLLNGLMWEGFIQEDCVDLSAEEVLILGAGGTLSEDNLCGIDENDVVCRLWYDWSVSSKFLYTDTQTSTGFPDFTPILPSQHTPSDDDNIRITLNKAWMLQGFPETAIGSGMGHGSNDLIFKTGGDNGKSYVRLDDDFTHSTSRTTSGGGQITCTHCAGGLKEFPRLSTNSSPITSKDIDFDNFTFFFVGEVRSNVDAVVIKFQTTDDSFNETLLRFRHKKAGSTGRYVIEFVEIPHGDDHTEGTVTTIDSGCSLDTDIVLMTGVGSGVGDSKLYKNGDTSDGITDADSSTGSLDYTLDNSGSGFSLGSDVRLLATGATSAGTNTNWDWDNPSVGSNDNKMYELIWYDRELTADERSAIETHLINKYDIS
mgnify:CR=1 FL=1